MDYIGFTFVPLVKVNWKYEIVKYQYIKSAIIVYSFQISLCFLECVFFFPLLPFSYLPRSSLYLCHCLARTTHTAFFSRSNYYCYFSCSHYSHYMVVYSRGSRMFFEHEKVDKYCYTVYIYGVLSYIRVRAYTGKLNSHDAKHSRFRYA